MEFYAAEMTIDPKFLQMFKKEKSICCKCKKEIKGYEIVFGSEKGIWHGECN